MFKILVYFFSLTVIFALNMVFFKFHGSMPNLLFLLVIVYSFRKDNPDFIWLAFFAGLLLDLYSNVFFGTYTVSFMIIALGINYTTRSFFSAEPSVVYFGLVAAVSSLVLVGLLFILNSVGVYFQRNLGVTPTVYLNQKIWLDLLFNLIFVGPIFYLSSSIEDFLENHAKRNSNGF
jgi:rod shape-determining protein MreD